MNFYFGIFTDKSPLMASVTRLIALFARPLCLTVNNTELKFMRQADLAFALAGRTAVPAERVNELMDRGRDQVEAELENLLSIETRLGNILADQVAHIGSCADGVAGVGVKAFSNDHDWRSIIASLLVTKDGRERYLPMALSAYQKYVLARQVMCKVILGLGTARQTQAKPAPAAFNAAQTAIFDADDYIDQQATEDPMRRLPPGEAVRLMLPDGAVIPIKLARHQFVLTHGRQWTLTADNGQRFALSDGFNSVGRSQDNDVSLGASFRNVSRKHLLVQTLGNDAVELTDVSSFGTYIPPAAIAS